MGNGGTVNINADDGIDGSIYGTGSVIIGDGTTATNYFDSSTHFGKNDSGVITYLNSLIISSGSSLTLNNAAYITTTTNNGTLNLNTDSFLGGTVKGGTVNINTHYDNSYYNTVDSSFYYTTFGTNATDAILELNITEGNSLILNNTNYINTINILSIPSIDYPSLSLKGADKSNMSLNLNDSTAGISYETDGYFETIISLRNTKGDTNNEYMDQMYNLIQILNRPAQDEDGNGVSLDFSNNNLYLNIISTDVDVGEKFFIDSWTVDYFAEASLTYEGIFTNLKLETEFDDKTNLHNLYLVVKNNRYPTTDIVSEATITAANVINTWTFLDQTLHDMILVSNLQNIEDDGDFYHALQNITPDVSGLNKEMAKKSLEISLNNIDKRLGNYRMMKFNSNSADYNMKRQKGQNIEYYEDYFTKPFYESNVWVEGFGGTFKQNTVENIFGYESTFAGLSLGYDVRVNNNFLFGVSYTLNQYDANDLDYISSTRDDMSATTNNFDLYSMIYGKWAYLSLNAGGSYNEYKQQRKINFYNFDKVAKSDYKGYSYYGKSEFGFNILLYNNANKEVDTVIKNLNLRTIEGNKQKKLKTYKKGFVDNFIMLTPKVAATYGNIIIEDFHEKGADAADLEIETEDYEFLNVSAGLAISLNNTLSNGMMFKTVLDGYVNKNLKDNKVELRARYEDDTQYFNVHGFEIDELSYSGGISFNLDFSENFSMGIGYNYVSSAETVGQMLKLNMLIMF